MPGKNYKRKKKVRKARILIGILILAGCFVMCAIFRTRLSEVDIVLDAGHGGSDPGAVSGDVFEKEITLEIAKTIKELLKESGYKVGMTREEDCFVGLSERAKYANKKKAKVFVSIHCNASDNPDGNGIETFYNEQKQWNDNVLADMIQQAVIEQTNANDRGIKEENYTVIVRSNMPAVLIEVGFLSNEMEKEILQDENYQKKLAKGIVQGIIGYLQLME